MKCVGISFSTPKPTIEKLNRGMLGAMLLVALLGGCKKDDGSGSSNADHETAPASVAGGGGELDSQAGATNGDSVIAVQTGSGTTDAIRTTDIPEIPLKAFEPVIQVQLSKAINAAKSAPESADAVGSLAMLFDSYNLHNEASLLYQRANALDPSEFRWAYLGGRLLFLEGKGERAVEFLTNANTIKPDDSICQIALINALTSVDRLQEAGKLAAKLLEKHPKHPLASYLLGSINLKLKSPIFAMEYLKPVFEQFPSMGGVRRDMAATLEMLGQTEKAEKIRAVEVNNNRVPSIEDPHHEAVLELAIGTNVENERGAYALMRGDNQSAQGHFAKALEYSPDNISAMVGLADTHLRLREFEECEKALKKLNFGQEDSVAGTVLTAKLRLAQGRFEEVEEIIKRAEELGAKPDHIQKLRFGLAAGNKDLPTMVRLLEVQANDNPGIAQNHFELANALVFSDRYDDAEKEYNKTLELEPRHAGAMEGLGALYTSRGENNAARTWYLKAFEHGGTSPRTLSWAGRDALNQGDYERGLAILSQAYAAYPNDTDLGDILSRMYSLCPEPSLRDWEKAMRIAVELYGDDEETMPLAGLHTLAAAHAEADNFDEAARLMEVGVTRASEGDNPNSILQFSKSKRQYTARKHLYEPEFVPSEYE